MPAASAHGSSVLFASVLVGGLTTIGIPDESKDLMEVTSHDSGGDREYVPGLRDGGTVELTARLVPEDPGQQALWANYDADNVVEEVVISAAPDADSNIRTWTFNAFVTSTGGALPFDGPGEVTFSLKIDGPVVRNSI